MSYLTLLEEKVGKKGKSYLNSYKCICGNIKLALPREVRNGHVKSCGCLKRGILGSHSFKHGMIKHPLYNVWNNMIRRCNDVDDPHYKDYGGRGVRVCKEWEDNFINFYNWAIENGWKRKLEVDKDKKGDGKLYSPNTCSIVTHKENCNTRRNSFYIIYKGETKTIAQWADQYKLRASTLRHRIVSGWDLRDAFTYPIKKKRGGVNIYVRSINYSFGYIN